MYPRSVKGTGASCNNKRHINSGQEQLLTALAVIFLIVVVVVLVLYLQLLRVNAMCNSGQLLSVSRTCIGCINE